MIPERLTEVFIRSRYPNRTLVQQYRQTVKHLLDDLVTKYNSPSAIFPRMRGVFPAEVVRYESGQHLQLGEAGDQAIPCYDPQLHALEYEWYFTGDTARDIGREFASKRGTTACLGVPTVASAAISGGRDVVFIDRNPRVLKRFPALTRASEVHLMDASLADRLNLNVSVLLFDPPWYLGDTLSWLIAASRLVTRGGTIVFALYPSLVRPAAHLERNLILEVASAIGAVEINEDGLAYQTPLFESEALKACGVRYAGDWRRGDLVAIKNSKAIDASLWDIPQRDAVDGLWQTFVIGPQVVKLRTSPSGHCDDLGSSVLVPLGGSFVLPFVSGRDSRRDAVDVWTSTNRAASASDARVLADIFRKLEAGICLDHAVQPHEDQFGVGVRDQVRQFLLLEN